MTMIIFLCICIVLLSAAVFVLFRWNRRQDTTIKVLIHQTANYIDDTIKLAEAVKKLLDAIDAASEPED